MENINFIKLSDVITKNMFELYDIILYDKIFLQQDVEYVKISLCINNDTSLLNLNTDPNIDTNKLDMYKYNIYVHGHEIYNGELNHEQNIFPTSNLPLSKGVYHNLFVVIKNLSLEFINLHWNNMLKITWKKSNQNFANNNFLEGIDIEWTNGYPDDIDNNNLIRFISGYVGIINHHYTNISDDYLSNNKNIFTQENISGEHYIYNLNHLDHYSNYVDDANLMCDNYKIQDILFILVNKLPKINNKSISILGETIKIPCDKFSFDNYDENTGEYIYKSTNIFYEKADIITNIKILMQDPEIQPNIDKIILNTKNNLNTNVDADANTNESIYNNFELEFSQSKNNPDNLIKSYDIIGLDNFIQIPTIYYCETSITIYYKFNKKLNKSQIRKVNIQLILYN